MIVEYLEELVSNNYDVASDEIEFCFYFLTINKFSIKIWDPCF